MKKTVIKVKKILENARIPTYGTDFSGGADLYVTLEKEVKIAPNETKFLPTGIAYEIPEGLVGLVFARSGLASKKGLAPATKVSVIDSDYRGELQIPLHNHSNEEKTIEDGDRVAQIVFVPYAMGHFMEVGELQESVRGQGGFGSTGKK